MSERHIYFAQRSDGCGPIKIGVSGFLKDRIYQLGVDYRASFAILASAPGDHLTERNVHLKFSAHRVEINVDRPGATEWFAPVPRLLAFVEKVRSTGKIPLSKADQRQWIFAERYLAGETLQQIADDFGITRERVRQILRKIGVPSLGLRPEHCPKAHELTLTERRAAKLYRDGTPPQAIIEQTGLTHAQLRSAIIRCDIPIKPRGYWLTKPNDAEITAQVCEMYRAGCGPKEIVAAVPDVRFPETVYRYLEKGGVPARQTNKRGDIEAHWKEIVARYHAGATQAAIADEFGACVNTIARLLDRHDARLSPEETERRRRAAVAAANRRRAKLGRLAA